MTYLWLALNQPLELLVGDVIALPISACSEHTGQRIKQKGGKDRRPDGIELESFAKFHLLTLLL